MAVVAVRGRRDGAEGSTGAEDRFSKTASGKARGLEETQEALGIRALSGH